MDSPSDCAAHGGSTVCTKGEGYVTTRAVRLRQGEEIDWAKLPCQVSKDVSYVVMSQSYVVYGSERGVSSPYSDAHRVFTLLCLNLEGTARSTLHDVRRSKAFHTRVR